MDGTPREHTAIDGKGEKEAWEQGKQITKTEKPFLLP